MITLPPGPFAGYIFDCDGTLALSMPVHFQAWQRAFAKHGASFEFSWDLFRSLGGLGLHHTVEFLNDRFKDTLDPSAVVEDQEIFVEEHLHQVKPNKEVVDIARSLYGKHPICVASGGYREGVHEILEIIGVSELFEIVVTQSDVTRGKPAPDIFLLAAQKMGVEPTKCLVFEDSPPGIQAAKNAKMQYVHVKPQIPGLHR